MRRASRRLPAAETRLRAIMGPKEQRVHWVVLLPGQTEEEAYAAYRHTIDPADYVILQVLSGGQTPETLARLWGHRPVAPAPPGQPVPEGLREWEEAVAQAARHLERSRSSPCEPDRKRLIPPPLCGEAP
jgi:hypothetical protein